jgi:hypothetical protein
MFECIEGNSSTIQAAPILNIPLLCKHSAMYRRHSAPLVNSLDILAHAVNGVRDLEEVVLGDVHRRCELRRDLAQLRADDVVLHTQKKNLTNQ